MRNTKRGKAYDKMLTKELLAKTMILIFHLIEIDSTATLIATMKSYCSLPHFLLSSFPSSAFHCPMSVAPLDDVVFLRPDMLMTLMWGEDIVQVYIPSEITALPGHYGTPSFRSPHRAPCLFRITRSTEKFAGESINFFSNFFGKGLPRFLLKDFKVIH